MSKRQMEYKQLPFYVQKYDSDQGIVDAIVAVMGNIDQQGDIIENGSFTKTITERGHKIKVLDNHSAGSVRDVVGKINFLREVGRNELPEPLLGEYADATGGLFASIQFLVDTPEGVGIFKRIKAGVVDQYSIGYDALDYAYENIEVNGQKVNVRRLKTIRLWEISPVVFASNEGTMTVAAKAQPSEAKPWATFPVGGEFCVFRVDADGNRTGEALGCHGTEEAAQQQVEALYAAEPEAGGKGGGEQEATEEKVVPDTEAERDESGEAKGISGKTDWPLASRERGWDNAAAEKRVRSWAGAGEGPNAKYRSCHFWYDAQNADNFTAYKLLFCDVVDGRVHAVPRGVFAVAAVLQGARGGAAIPEGDQAKIKSRVAGYYARMRREFNDDGIVPPWEKSASTEKDIEDNGKRVGITVARQAGTNELKFVWQDDEGKHHEITEGEIRDIKEGRVLSTANAKRILSAVTALIEALESAGIDINEHGKARPSPSETPTSEEEVGPEEGKTTPTNELLKLIEIEREQISMMEV